MINFILRHLPTLPIFVTANRTKWIKGKLTRTLKGFQGETYEVTYMPLRSLGTAGRNSIPHTYIFKVNIIS